MWPSLYRLFEEVKRHSTVALSGEAADELFGGYPWFHSEAALAEDTFGWIASPTRKYFDGKGLLDESLLRKLDLKHFVQDSYAQAVAEAPTLAGENPLNARMRRELYIHLTRCVPIMLDRKDRMSMAVGLEVRVPFCDHRLVEYAFNTPWHMHTFDGREKSILRAAAQDILPEAILSRQKNPYPSTQDPAYEANLRNSLEALKCDPNAPVRDLLDMDKVGMILARDQGRSSPRENRIAMELAIGLNDWLRDYEVTIAL